MKRKQLSRIGETPYKIKGNDEKETIKKETIKKETIINLDHIKAG